MTTDYTVSSKLQNTLTNLMEKFSGVEENILELLNIWKQDPISDQINSDLEKIETCQKKFSKLANSLDQYLKQNTTPNADDLRTYRHDLRGSIGGIIGFSELILEDLEVVENYAKLKASLQNLLNKTEPVLNAIEEISIPEEDNGFSEDDTYDQSYCALVYTGRILIIDDDAEKIEMIARRLEQVGHTILTATDGAKALKTLNSSSDEIDCILLDMLMPGMDGYSVLLKLKESQKLRDIPVLIISSVSDTKNVIRCIRAGADDYLPMPVDTTLLNARVNSCIYKKLMRDREQKNLMEMDELRQQLSKAIESIDEGFAIFDAKDRLITCNDTFKTLYPGVESLGNGGFTYEDLLRENIKLGVYRTDRRHSQKTSDSYIKPDEVNDWVRLRLSYYNNANKPYAQLLTSGKWIEVIENKIPGGGTVAIHKDISESRKREEALNYLATHDPLTGLANRTLFDTKLSKTIENAEKSKTLFGIIFFDLDHFKKVNDTLGHEFGDFLLVQVANHLKKCTREEDVVARLGGDEFAAIIENIDSIEPLEVIAKRCLDAIGTSITRDGKTAHFGVSIGIASYPTNGDTIREILNRADEAMYAAKKTGKGTYRFAS